MSAATWDADVKNSLQNFDTAAEDYLENSKASSTLTNSFTRQMNGGSAAGNARLIAKAHLDDAYNHLAAIGYPGIDQLTSFRDQAKQIDSSNVQAGLDKLHKVEGAVAFTTTMAIGAGAVKLLARGLEAADAEMAGAEAVKDIGPATRSLFNTASKSKALLESISSSAEGAANLQKAITDASEAMTAGNMLPMAVMPFGFSAVTSAADVAIDRHAGQQGNLVCRFVNNMSNSMASNIMMANFAWAAPATVLAGGLAEATSGGKIAAESAMAQAEAVQKFGFDGMMVKGTVA